MKKNIFTLLLAVIAGVTMVHAQATSGTCGAQGSNLTWELRAADGVLTINGTGAMEDYCYGMFNSGIVDEPENPWAPRRAVNPCSGPAPWDNYPNTRIKGLEIANGVTSLGDDAFCYCSYMTKNVTIPGSVTKFGDRAFYECSTLWKMIFTSATPPTVGNLCFYNCPCTFYVPCGTKDAYMTALGVDASRVVEAAFGTCGAKGSNLTWTLSCDGVLTISGTGAMADYTSSNVPWSSYCSSITSVVISEGVTNIGSYAFYNCNSMTSVTIPNSVTSIKSYAFYRCNSVTSITIGDNVTSIGTYAFADCRAMTSLTIGSGVTTIGSVAFSFCTSLQSVTCYATTPPSGGSGSSMYQYCTLYVPGSVVETYQNTAWWQSFTSILPIPGTEPAPCLLASGTFGAQGNNLSWELSCDSVLTISGTGAMADYSSTTEPWQEYENAIRDVIIEDGLTYIGTNAFANCLKMKSIAIPDSVTSIGIGIFLGCPRLTYINVDANNANFSSEDNVLFNKDKTTLIRCPQSYTGTSYTIPNSVTCIGEAAFNECRQMTTITMSNSVTRIEQGAFASCTNLTSVTLSENITSIGYATFSHCVNLASVNISDGITSMGNHVFEYCRSLTSINIPNSLTKLGDVVYGDCTGLTSVTIPNGITSIGMGTFNSCRGLTSVTCEAVDPPTLGRSVFNNVDKSIPLYVPSSSITAYQVADGWKDFTNIQAIPGTEPAPCLLASGTCGAQGDNLTWELDCDHVLTIRGTGAMAYHDQYQNLAPWADYTSDIYQIVIEEGVTSVGANAFYRCNKVTEISLSNTITSIGNNAFIDCNITSVTIPSSVTSIGGSVFENCARITSISVEAGNTVYDSRDNCNAIIETATNTLFLGCQNTVIPNSVTGIGSSAFAGRSGLTTIAIPNSVTNIGIKAFYRSGLSSINLPNNLTTIQNAAFSGCNLNSVIIPSSVTNIGMTVFSSCYGLRSIVVEEGNPKYDSRDNCNAIIETSTNNLIQGCYASTIPEGVTSIASEAFLYTYKNSITIPSSVTIIKSSAFRGCPLRTVTCEAVTPPAWQGSVFMDVNISSIPLYVPAPSIEAYQAADQWSEFTNILPIPGTEPTPCIHASGTCGAQGSNLTWQLSCDSVLTISGTGAMKSFGPWTSYAPWCTDGCRDSIRSVVIEEGVTVIGDYAFYDCTNLQTVSIPAGVTTIANNAFNNCSSLVSVTLPAGVTSIGQYAFRDCVNLESINLPYGVTSLNGTFYNCAALSSIEIPNSVTEITYYAFGGCSSLTSVTIPGSVVTIGNQRAFENCTNLATLIIEEGVTSIDKYTFVNCTSLTSVVIPNSVTTIKEGAFSQCTNLASVTLGSGLTTIDAYAFSKCKISTCAIPSNVQTIGKSAFIENEFEQIIVPEGVQSIGEMAFSWNPNLTMASIPSSATDLGDAPFTTCKQLETLVVAEGNPRYDSRNNCNAIIETATNILINGCKTTIVPEGIKEIGKEAFYQCQTLETIVLPNTITTIRSGAFDGAGLKSIIIPQSVTSIEKRAFVNSHYLRSMEFLSATPPSIDIVLMENRPDVTMFFNMTLGKFYVPCGAKDAYVPVLGVDESKVIEKMMYHYSAFSSNEEQGTVNITQEPTCSDLTFAFNAEAEEGWQFKQWSDGETANPRTLQMTKDTVITAEFELAVQEPVIIADGENIDLDDLDESGTGNIAEIEIQPGGELNINLTDVRIGVITIISTGSQSGQIHGNHNNIQAERIFMEYVLNPYGSNASPDRWYAFAVPFEVDIATGITRAYGKKSHVPGSDFLIMEYDGQLRAESGKGWKEKNTGTLKPGHFYMIGIDGNCNRWLFEKKSDAAISGNNHMNINSYIAGNSNNGKHNGWNGMGNTQLEYSTMDLSGLGIDYLLIYNNTFGKYEIVSFLEASLCVGQPFFIQAPSNGSFDFLAGSHPSYAPAALYAAREQKPVMHFTLSNENQSVGTDHLYLTMHEDAAATYTIGRDVERMTSDCRTAAQLWCTIADGTQLNAHDIATPATATTVDLGLFAPAAGVYQLAMATRDMEGYQVELLLQGTVVATLFDAQPLTLNLSKGNNSGYTFRISRKTPTGLGEVQSDKVQSTKELINGVLYIFHNGRMYDAQGQIVK